MDKNRMTTTLNVGNEVYINAGIEPNLIVVITEFREESKGLLACGEYGCTPVDLLTIPEPVPAGAPGTPIL